MTSLSLTKLNVKRSDIGPESTLPMLYEVDTREEIMPSVLGEDDGLYLRYRFIKSAFPYRALDNYGRELCGGELDGIVLENERLRASFAPSMGGKLWSLYDKLEDKELLFSNPVARPAYLATRNAWCSGGVEWNCGIFGHTPFTCSPLFAAALDGPDGEQILRMYEFERVRGVVYQMDFSLPSGSPVLFARMRVVNPSFRDTAMYWWSNIALPEVKGSRMVVPADCAYTPVDGAMTTVPTPVRDGINVTYPYANPVSVDYFFKTDPARSMYTCQLSPEGYGLFEASTSRLKGRKIFVWGRGPGGRKWQEYLSGEGNPGRYCELQCGLAHTQSECLPMPPATAWEWLEIFGPLHADPQSVHSDNWDAARREVESRIDEILSAPEMEKRLRDSRATALTPASRLLYCGAGWGALENLRREKNGLSAMCPHLDFGKPRAEQEAWLNLMEHGTMGEMDARCAPVSWMRQREWTLMLEEAALKTDSDNWYTLLQLGCTYLAEPDLLRADIYISRSLAARRTAWGVYALAELTRIRGEEKRSAMLMTEAASLAPDDANLAKITARALFRAGDMQNLRAFTATRADAIRELPRIRLYEAFAEASLGEFDRAEAILCRNGEWLQVPDIQEGELSLSDLWYMIREGIAAREGRTFDRDKVNPPYELDFRMFAMSDSDKEA